MRKSIFGIAALALAALPLAALADITVGVIVSLTGPAASLGIPAKNTVEVMPQTVAGHKIRFVVLDDASDATNAVKNARKLIDEDKVDIILGPSVTPTSLATLEVIGPAQTPMISLAGSGAIILPPEGNRRWAFKLAPNEPIQGAYIFDHMQKAGGKTLAHFMHANAFGESFSGEMTKIAVARGIPVVASEKYAPNDTSVAAQALKVMLAKPDAVIVSASGTSGVMPVSELKKQGYRGQIYINQGMANNDVLRVGGRDLEGILFPVSPVLVAEQLPDSNPVKQAGLDYVRRYEAKFGPGSRSLFGATAWDAFLMFQAVVPAALKAGQPGSAAFRVALRDNLEKLKDFAGSQGVFSMSEKDHNGTDRRAQVLVKIEGGKWVYMP